MRPRSTRLPALTLAGAVAVAGVLLPTLPATAADGLDEKVTIDVTGGGHRLSTIGEVRVTPYRRSGDDFVAQGTWHGGAGYPLEMTLAEGDYKFRVTTDSPLWEPEYYNDAADLEQAEVVTVEDDPIVLDPVDLDPLENVLVGRVVDDEGEPVAGSTVQVFRTGAGFQQSVATDLDGIYRVATGVPGSYQLQFLSPSGSGLAPEWYDDAAVSADAESFTLPTGGAGIRVPDVELLPSGSVSGRVTGDGGVPLDDVMVRALASTGESLGSVDTDADGRYRIDGLKPGDVLIGFEDTTDTYVREFHADAETLAAATPVVVAAGQDTGGIDATLAVAAEPVAHGAAIRGRALDTSGRPVRGVYVSAWRLDGDDWEWVEGDRTDRFGRYLLDDIEGATADGQETRVRVEFENGGGRGPFYYRGTYYGQQPTVRRAPDVVVGWDEVRTGIDGVLQQHGGLRGTVTKPPAGDAVVVRVYDLDGRLVDEPWIDQNTGAWELTGLVPGDYKVQADDRDPYDSDFLAPRWWTAGHNFTTATPITVGEGTFAPDVDLALTDQLAVYDVPTITGSPVVGQVLRATPGRWNVNVGVEHSYEWLRGETVVGTDPTYPVGPADVGAPLRVRITARFWDWTGVATSAATAPVTAAVVPVPPKQTSRTSVRASYDKRRRTVTLKVTVAAASVPQGMIAVTEGRRTAKARVALRNGQAKVVVKRPRAGRHTYVVTYAGSELVLPSSGSARVKVAKPRRR